MDINSLSIELAKTIESDSLNKAIPPKLYYRLRRFLLMAHPKHVNNPEMIERVKNAVAEKSEELLALRELKKNEFMASVYDSGSIKLDFGSGVPEQVKKAAMSWARRKGLKPVEASLDKSANPSSSFVFSSGTGIGGQCVKRVKWELGE